MDDLRGGNDKPVAIANLRGLRFGNCMPLGDGDAMDFAAGPEDETEGLFGPLRVAA